MSLRRPFGGGSSSDGWNPSTARLEGNPPATLVSALARRSRLLSDVGQPSRGALRDWDRSQRG